jgi:hypothetical protein
LSEVTIKALKEYLLTFEKKSKGGIK